MKAKTFLSLLAIAFLAATSLPQAKAQSTAPQMVVTWQAYGSYIPPEYAGKALPNQESELTASLELLSNGKPVGLSGQTIYWYLNNTLIASNKSYIIFSALGTPPAFLTLKVELPNYNGNLLTHQVQIPLVSPKAIIKAPHPTAQIAGSPIVLQATPYFFYISDARVLSYAWSVNGQTSAAAENPQILQINLDPSTPSGSSLDVSLVITNPNDSTSGNDLTNVIYVKQL